MPDKHLQKARTNKNRLLAKIFSKFFLRCGDLHQNNLFVSWKAMASDRSKGEYWFSNTTKNEQVPRHLFTILSTSSDCFGVVLQ
ncbi:unnamed protein product [Candidatus Protochlamydia amoebophila UWE25]|uniref:Uncharacterized protein n=1 Tax=Protochlamydia amoebophila (strain UWE25) TaxID=264201 RepID=Q6MCZ1_PARUW|nr:unnamed protein product [Candidatus Protochlamydia amoebophila UWE25]